MYARMNSAFVKPKVISLALWETRLSHYTCSKGVMARTAHQYDEQLESSIDQACL